MPSIWADTADLAPRTPWAGTLATDVLIIGGGITGILCAHLLQDAGVRCVVVEARRIGCGVTQNTTGKITLQHGLCYAGLMQASRERAQGYLLAQQEALTAYETLCRRGGCDYVRRDAYVYTLRDPTPIHQEARALQDLGVPVTTTQALPLPLPVQGAVCCPDQAQCHPLKLLFHLAAPLTVYEETPVLRVEGTAVTVPQGTITAQRIVFACHFPFVDRHGAYFAKMYQHRSYALALEGAPHLPGMYVDACEPGLSFRMQGDLLLVGGGDHKTGQKGGGYAALRQFVADRYPAARERYAWAAQDCIPLDNIPYIGQYAKSTPRWYVATGFRKWGMSNAMVAAMLLRDALTGRHNDYAPVFAPDRSMLHPQLIRNGLSSALHMLTPSLHRCTHLGCALHKNREEGSWDCPCHGSRFDERGRVLDNPAERRARVGRLF